MRRSDPLLMLADRDRLRRLEESAGAVGELFEIHLNTPRLWGRYGVAHRQHNPSEVKFLAVSPGLAEAWQEESRGRIGPAAGWRPLERALRRSREARGGTVRLRGCWRAPICGIGANRRGSA